MLSTLLTGAVSAGASPTPGDEHASRRRVHMGTTSGDEPPRRDPRPAVCAQRISEAPSTARTVLVTATAALGGFLFGYDTAVINGAVKAVGEAYAASPFVLGLA